ncbi:hypothetical protein JWG39_08375 [Desulforhopalus vacuolatus]|uniref:hypothetical protein n=1 Tax=Desulforhopalus vacuolatus TaxID=40414 RepID=UPI0019649B54|nr:hypothetical protein [Desulforhopalus vacuolatus]MBM9519832.1 hypothetical protein [Desulforhopalus vacuolatus]
MIKIATTHITSNTQCCCRDKACLVYTVTLTAAMTPIITVTAAVTNNPKKNTPAKLHTIDKNHHDAQYQRYAALL